MRRVKARDREDSGESCKEGLEFLQFQQLIKLLQYLQLHQLHSAVSFTVDLVTTSEIAHKGPRLPLCHGRNLDSHHVRSSNTSSTSSQLYLQSSTHLLPRLWYKRFVGGRRRRGFRRPRLRRQGRENVQRTRRDWDTTGCWAMLTELPRIGHHVLMKPSRAIPLMYQHPYQTLEDVTTV